MHSVLLLIALMAATPSRDFADVDSAGAALADELSTGSLLLSDGDCLAVKIYTRSPYTHVAGVVRSGDRITVYDSQNGAGVRKLSLHDYLSATRPHRLHVLRPARPFEAESAGAFEGHLESELGRPYAVTHHLTGKRCEGLHCAEYLSDALVAASVVSVVNPTRVSPASLRSGLLKYGLYDEVMVAGIAAPAAWREPGRNVCEELWLDTKDCCGSCWDCFRRKVLCR